MMGIIELKFHFKSFVEIGEKEFEGEMLFSMMNVCVNDAKYKLREVENTEEKLAFEIDITGTNTDFKFILEFHQNNNILVVVSKASPSFRPTEQDREIITLEKSTIEQTHYSDENAIGKKNEFFFLKSS